MDYRKLLVVVVALFIGGRVCGQALEFRRGDGNADGHVDIGDAYAILYSLIDPSSELSCAKAADADDSGSIQLADGSRILSWLFSGGLTPSSPGPSICGLDPTDDLLDCRTYSTSLCEGVAGRPVDQRFALLLDRVPESITGTPGTTVTFDVLVQLCSDLPVRGWSVAVEAGGDIRIPRVRTDRTLADLTPRGLRSETSFEESAVTQLRDGAASAVVLDLVEEVELPATGTGETCVAPNNVLILTIEATIPIQGFSVGRLELVDGVRVLGQPVENLVTYVDGGRPGVARPQLGRWTFTIGESPCPPDPVACTELHVDGPAGGAPGQYLVAMGTTGGSGSALYRFGAVNQQTNAALHSGVEQQNTAIFGLTEGTWTLWGSVSDGPDCPVSVCESVTQVVQCIEEPDSVSISGLTEGQVGSAIQLVATFLGADPGSDVGYVWDVVGGAGQLIGTTEEPVAQIQSAVEGDVTVRVRSGDERCGNVVEATHTVRFEDCPAANATCRDLMVSGPEDEGPGVYVATVTASVPAGEEALYFFRVQNPETGAIGEAAGPFNEAQVELPPGTWVFSAAVGIDPQCPFDACSPVEVVVRCFEEPDAVEIVGPEEVQVDEVAELTARFSGADAGGEVTYAWEVVMGPGEIVGATDTSSVEVMSSEGGEVTVRVRSGDGVCAPEAEALHTLRFLDCPPPGSVSCDGVDVAGPPGNASGEYVITATATVPANDEALYRYLIENPETGESATAGPGPASEVRATLPIGTWDIRVEVLTDVGCPYAACDPVRVVVTEDGVGPFARGDCNADQTLNVTDAICMLGWLLVDGASVGCVAATNVNGDGGIDTSDAIYLLLFLTSGGVEPVAPFPACSRSATEIDKALGCETPPAYCQ